MMHLWVRTWGVGAGGARGGEGEGGVRGRAWGVGPRGPRAVVMPLPLVLVLLLLLVRTGLLVQVQGQVLGQVLQVGSTLL